MMNCFVRQPSCLKGQRRGLDGKRDNTQLVEKNRVLELQGASESYWKAVAESNHYTFRLSFLRPSPRRLLSSKAHSVLKLHFLSKNSTFMTK